MEIDDGKTSANMTSLLVGGYVPTISKNEAFSDISDDDNELSSTTAVFNGQLYCPHHSFFLKKGGVYPSIEGEPVIDCD